MKLILSLLILTFINSINSQLVVDKTFTIAKCNSSPYQPTFVIDQCTSYCGASGTHLKFSYDFENNKYVATTYQDNYCEEKTKEFSVDCPQGNVDGNLVECSDPVKVLDFSNFTVTGTNCPNGGVNIPYSKCVSSCDNKYTTITKVAGQLNSYQIGFSETNDCKGPTNIYPLFCGSNNEQYTTQNGYGVVCQNSSASTPSESSETANESTDSAASTLIVYSSILLLSILFNILL